MHIFTFLESEEIVFFVYPLNYIYQGNTLK